MHIPLRRLGVYCVAFVFAIVDQLRAAPADAGEPRRHHVRAARPARHAGGDRGDQGALRRGRSRCWQQFLDYIKGVVTLDLGVSVKYYPHDGHRGARPLAGWTAFLVVTAIIFSLCVGSPSAQWRPGGAADASTRSSRRSPS